MMIGALSRRQKVYLCGENSRAKKHTQAAWEKRERKKRAVHRKRSAKKKNEKTRSRHSLFCEVSLKKRKEKEVLFFYRQTVVKLFHKSILNARTFYPLSSSPEHTHILRHQTRTREEWLIRKDRTPRARSTPCEGSTAPSRTGRKRSWRFASPAPAGLSVRLSRE